MPSQGQFIDVSTHVHSFLKEFGLTENQIKIYCYVAHRGPQKATVIAKALSMHKMQVYRDLQEMEKQGVVQLAFSEPKQFITCSINDLIDEKLQQLKANLEALEAQKTKISSDWRTHLLQESPRKIERFAIIQGEKKLFAAVEALRRRAQREMCSLIPPWGLVKANLLGYHDKIMQGKVRFKYRIITQIPDEEVPNFREVLQKYTPCENVAIHYTKVPLDPFPIIGLIDDEEAVLIMQPVEGVNLSSLWTNNKVMVNLMRNYFEELWLDSSDVQTILHMLPLNNTGS